MSVRLTLSRRALAAAGALGLAAAVVAGTALSVDETSAAWTDNEVAQATAPAAWPVGWAGVQAARIYTPKIQHTHGYDTTYRSQAKNFDTSSGAGSSDVSLRQSLVQGGTAGANGVQTEGSGSYTLETGGYPGASGSAPRVAMSSQSCSYVAPNYVAIPTGGSGSCGAGAGDMSAADHTLNSFGFNIDERGGAGDSYVNAFGIHTGVKCGTSSASVTSLSGQVDVSGTNKTLVVNDGRPTYYDGNYTTIWKTANGTSNTGLSGNFDTYRVLGVIEGVRYRPLVRTITQQNPPYALAEIGFYLDTYDGTFGARNPASKFYFSLSRSECGVRNVQPGGLTSAPSRADSTPALDILTNTTFPTNDKPFEDFQGATTLVAPVEPEGRIAAQAPAAKSPTGEALSTRAPKESATGADATTSAPPESGGITAPGTTEDARDAAGTEDGTSAVTAEETSASEASTAAETSAPAIPAEPGALPADTEKCGTVEVDGEELDAVIPSGAECDSDARRAASRALTAYIADDTQNSRWKPFTSGNPAADGWRWAAIDTKTGQVVYVE